MNMAEDERIKAANNMTQNEKDMIMTISAKENDTLNENVSATTMSDSSNKTLIGNYVGSGPEHKFGNSQTSCFFNQVLMFEISFDTLQFREKNIE
jgi:hypothetical protein